MNTNFARVWFQFVPVLAIGTCSTWGIWGVKNCPQDAEIAFHNCNNELSACVFAALPPECEWCLCHEYGCLPFCNCTNPFPEEETSEQPIDNANHTNSANTASHNNLYHRLHSHVHYYVYDYYYDYAYGSDENGTSTSTSPPSNPQNETETETETETITETGDEV